MAEIMKIEKVNGKHYQSWKYHVIVKLVFMERGLLGFRQGHETAPVEGEKCQLIRVRQLKHTH